MFAEVTVDVALLVYRWVATAGTPLVRLHLSRRSRHGKEDPARVAERLGYAGRTRPSGRLIWLHAASVGESLSALPLIKRIRSGWPTVGVLVTTGTVTSARLMAERLPPDVIHQFAPIDLPAAAARFLEHWRPDLAIFLESEFWPNLLTAVRCRGIEMVLVNGRMSATSYAGWARMRSLARRLLEAFTLILAQSPEDQERLKSLGAPDAQCVGNLKFAAAPLAADADELARLRQAVGKRQSWLAASTHPGEEEMAGRVHESVAPNHPDLLTLLVPRHPHRGAEIAEALRRSGHRVARRSAGDQLTEQTDIYVADTIGELGLWYRLSNVVFIGGSLVPKGGQNPLEAARLDCAILCGPHMTNFRRITEEMTAARAIRSIADEFALATAVDELSDDRGQRECLARNAVRYADAQAGVLDKIVTALAPHLDRAAANP